MGRDSAATTTSMPARPARVRPRRPRATPTRGVDRLGPDEHGRSDGPRARERAGHRLRRNGRRAAAGAPPQRELVGARGLRRAAPAPAAVVPLLPARRPGPRDHPLGRRRRLPLRLAGRRPRGVRGRDGSGDVPPARVLDGRRDRAPVRGSSPRAAADARRHRDLAGARTADVRRAADDGSGVHRPRPALGGGPVPAARSRPGTRCLAPADAGHRAGRRRAAPPRAGGPDPDRRPDAGRRRRPGHVRPRRPGVGPEAPAARREAVRRPRLRPRGAGASAGAVQRGDRAASTGPPRRSRPSGPGPSRSGSDSAGGAAPRAGPAGA